MGFRLSTSGVITFFANSFYSKGLRVTDVWESKEDLEAFFAGRLGEGFKKVGIPGQPNMEIYPLHALFQSGGGRR